MINKLSRFEVQILAKDEWALVCENAHRAVFGFVRPPQHERIDFAMIVKEGDQLIGYATVRELDHESVYWQFGGGFPGTISSFKAVTAYGAIIEWTKERYKRITTLVENTNVRYLKLAMHYGFRIIGCRTFKGQVLVELLNEFEGEANGSAES